MHQTSKNSHMKICTWNSQGNPLNDAIKLNILNHLLTTEQCNVVMIQECGNFILPAQHSGRYHYVVVEHAGAYNCRCNTCIIADLNFVASIHYLISGTGRSAICLNYNGCNIYTLHCESGSGAVGDIRDLVRHAVSPFIIGGDMNSTPSELSEYLRIMTTGTRSRPGNSANFACCGMPTHFSGRELDYFLIDSRLQLRTCVLRYHIACYLYALHHHVLHRTSSIEPAEQTRKFVICRKGQPRNGMAATIEGAFV